MPYNGTPSLLAYLAGLVDGEGTISVYAHKPSKRNSRYALQPMLAVANTSKMLMVWLQEHFDGNVGIGTHAGRQGHSETCHQWTLTKREALRELLPGLVPYLVIKKVQAELLLYYLSFCHGSVGVKYSEELYQARMAFIPLFRELNAKGPGASEAKAELAKDILKVVGGGTQNSL